MAYEFGELDPDIAELMDIEQQPSAEIVEQRKQNEQDDRSVLERDLGDFKNMIADWEDVINNQLVQTRDDITTNYTSRGNVPLSPYKASLVHGLELKQRGADFVYCRQTFDIHGQQHEDLIGLYTPADKPPPPYISALE